ncbi:hypothetical protein RhiirC2_717794 [Rhizophagus irregularis]|uniref:Uncharacterized protein n=1 Tax=Rhizophagus irregularis TaxID=588596 RepID=A0A2N1ML11_9GLOM|nr:hypothetical protein RhiirC2_717794 [Rhizophagus irregularis]
MISSAGSYKNLNVPGSRMIGLRMMMIIMKLQDHSDGLMCTNSKKLSKMFKKLQVKDETVQQTKGPNVNFNDDEDEVYNNPNFHSEEQDEFEIPNGKKFTILKCKNYLL